MSSIGKRMRELRESAGLTQTEIANLCESNQTTIAKIETGKMPPSIKLLVWWADYFDVSLDYLCQRIDNPHGRPYTAVPKGKAGREIKQFIETCFNPKSQACKQIKAELFKIWRAASI